MKARKEHSTGTTDTPAAQHTSAPQSDDVAGFSAGSAASARQIQMQSSADKFAAQQHLPSQPLTNKTGLPDNLKSGIERLSGMALDDVRVHRNSTKPAQLQAHAYAQGTDIHLGPGQEKHLPHETWHVAQQKQGRVRPTLQLKGTTPINDDASLEREADVMGARAMQLETGSTLDASTRGVSNIDTTGNALQAMSFTRTSGLFSVFKRYTPQEQRLLDYETFAVKIYNKVHDLGDVVPALGQLNKELQEIKDARVEQDQYPTVNGRVRQFIGDCARAYMEGVTDTNYAYNYLFTLFESQHELDDVLETARRALLDSQGGDDWQETQLPAGFQGNYAARRCEKAALNDGDESAYLVIANKEFPHPSPVKGQVGATATPTDRFGYWFNNFYLLVRKNSDISTNGVAFCKRAFTPAGKPRAMSHAQMKQLLDDMMGQYMERFDDASPMGPMMATAAPPRPDLPLGQRGAFLSNDAQSGVAFRGDSRPLRQIQEQGGQTSKADVPVLREQYGMDKAWHPMSDPAVSNAAYYRKGMNDNDLFTVVSIAVSFLDATKFPLIEEMKDHETYHDAGGALCSDVTVYVLYVSDGFDTFAKQRRDEATYGKGEFATRHVPFDQHLAAIRVRRRHKGATGNDGHVATIANITPLNEARGRALLEDSGYQRLTGWLEQLEAQAHDYTP
ncbi:MAG: DUF4157 domain-containing protein [Gammaproteobacteria bacterium]